MPEDMQNQPEAIATESVAVDPTETVVPDDQAEAVEAAADESSETTDSQEDVGVDENQADTVQGGMSESEA